MDLGVFFLGGLCFVHFSSANNLELAWISHVLQLPVYNYHLLHCSLLYFEGIIVNFE